MGDRLTLKGLCESHVTWAISVPILVFLGLSFLEFDWMYATDKLTDVRHALLLNAPYPNGGHNYESSKTSYDRYHRGVLLVVKRLFPNKVMPYARICYPIKNKSCTKVCRVC